MAEEDKDSISKILGTVWGIYCGIVGTSIPLIAMTGDDAIAIPIIAGIGAGVTSLITVVKKTGKGAISKQEIDMLGDTIYSLKEQVSDMENEIDDLRLQHRITQQTLLQNTEAKRENV